MPTLVGFKYRAFLSYAHADLRWGRWLHTRLEGFTIDKDLVERVTALGPVPKSLRPIFRDLEDFSGGHSLNEATIAALDQSAALIVVCSAVSATRPAVNEEVRLFRYSHPDRPVIPVIIGGSYPENFPAALRFEIAADGSITDEPVTILGPDLRDTGEGRQLGLAKIVAGLTASRRMTSSAARSGRGDGQRQYVPRSWLSFSLLPGSEAISIGAPSSRAP